MNYFLIANNRNNNILKTSIDKLSLDPTNDIVVLFNFLFPMKYSKIRNHTNKICVSRLRPINYRQTSIFDKNIKEFYCNMSVIKNNEQLFEEIYFVPCPYLMGKNSESYIENVNLFRYNVEKLKCFEYDIEKMRKKLNYTATGLKYQVSTGVIYYNLLKDTKIEDNIILVAFTSEMTDHHECDWEKNYFLNEINSGKCYSIDSYGITNFY